MSTPASFQSAFSVLGLWLNDTVCLPFKSGDLVFLLPPGFPGVKPHKYSKTLEQRPTNFQSQKMWGLVLLVQVPVASSTWCMAWSPGSFKPVLSFVLVGHCTGCLVPKFISATSSLFYLGLLFMSVDVEDLLGQLSNHFQNELCYM